MLIQLVPATSNMAEIHSSPSLIVHVEYDE